MDCVVLVDDGLLAEGALSGSGFALLEVEAEVLGGDVEFAVLAVFGLHEAGAGVLVEFVLLEHFGAVGALGCAVELLLVVFQEVSVVHLPASCAL